MAEIIENKKEFKVIKMSNVEVCSVFGGFGICDSCNRNSDEGYYVAVLNLWYCERCYQSFLETATNYPEDGNIEEMNFQNVLKHLELFKQ